MSNYILLTNDDGVDASGIQLLAQALINRNYRIVILAPEENKSASGMSISLRKMLRFTERNDISEKLGGARVYSLAGNPSDCIIVGLSGALDDVISDGKPMLCVSGVNLGPNVSVDLFHSGTVGAAREAGLYGLPAISTSLTGFEEDKLQIAVDATVKLVDQIMKIIPNEATNLLRPELGNLRDEPTLETAERMKSAFFRGDVFLNLNTPPDWNGKYKATKIGMRWYLNALHRENESAYSIDGVEIFNQPEGDCDVGAIVTGYSSLSVCPTWPQTHPLCLDSELISENLTLGESGLPKWIL